MIIMQKLLYLMSTLVSALIFRKKQIRFIAVFALVMTQSCASDESDLRGYAEGLIKSKKTGMGQVHIRLQSGENIIAETETSVNRSFVVSGPLISENFQIKLNHPIASFHTKTNGCKLSEDSMTIEMPNQVSYVKFDSLILR